MDSRDFKHQERDRLCYCCDTLQATPEMLNDFHIHSRGYGSKFDSSNITIQLCNECSKYIDPIWFTEEPKLAEDGYYENYIYEDIIRKFIDSFIIENQEYINNEHDTDYMERQDWIDYNNGVLSDEKIEEYGYYSPRQIKAYEDNFTTCNHPINIIYPSYKSCRCEYEALGEYGQLINENNFSEECYNCENYIKRFEPIKEMDEKQYKDYVRYSQAKRIYFELKDEFEK